MEYFEALNQAKTKFAAYINALLPENHAVSVPVFDKIIAIVAYFIWYQGQLPEGEQIEITFSNHCSIENGVVSVKLFAIDVYDESENEKFIEMLRHADIYEISANPQDGIDIDFTFKDLYIPCDEE